MKLYLFIISYWKLAFQNFLGKWIEYWRKEKGFSQALLFVFKYRGGGQGEGKSGLNAIPRLYWEDQNFWEHGKNGVREVLIEQRKACII
jgi:hypothetical protein